MNPYINLIGCEKGDLLVLKDGSLAKYVSYEEDAYFTHISKQWSETLKQGLQELPAPTEDYFD